MSKKNTNKVISSLKNPKGAEYMDDIPEDDDKIINDEADYGISPYAKTRDFALRIFPDPDW